MSVCPCPDQKNITDCIAIAKARLNHTRFPLFCNPLPLQLRLNLICATTLATSQHNLGSLKDVLQIGVLEDSHKEESLAAVRSLGKFCSKEIVCDMKWEHM